MTHRMPTRPGNRLPDRNRVHPAWYAATVATIIIALILGGTL